MYESTIQKKRGSRWIDSMRSIGLPPVLWPAIAFLLIVYLFPVMRLLALSFLDPKLSLVHYQHLFGTSVYLHVVLNTFNIALTVALVTLLLAYPTAYLLHTISRRLSSLLVGLVVIPLFTSFLVRNYAWIFLLGGRGVVNGLLIKLGLINQPLPLMFNRFGVVVAMVHILLPNMILILLSVMRGINPRLSTAAASLGAAPFTSFRRVFLPMSLPGVGAGFLLVFVLALAFFVTPAMLGGRRDVMIANVVAYEMGFLNWGFAAALAILLLLLTLIAIVLMQRFFGGLNLLVPGLETVSRIPRPSRVSEGLIAQSIDRILNPVWPYIAPLVGSAVFVFLILPVLLIVPLSFSPVAFFVFPPPGFSWQWYGEYLSSPDWLDSTLHSFQIGMITVFMSTAIAVPAALGIARSRSPLSIPIYLLIFSPLIVPGIFVAIAVFFLFTSVHLTGTVWGVALGHTIGGLSLATVVLVAALRNFDFNLERAALSLLASPLRAVFRVTLPVLSTAVVTAAFLVFLQSFDELLIALFVSGVGARTLPKKLWESLQEVNPTIAAVSTLLVAFTTLTLFTLYAMQRVSERRKAWRVAAPGSANDYGPL